MDKHEAKTLAILIRRKAKIGSSDVLGWISAPLVIVGLVSMVFEIITGLLVWKVLMTTGVVIGWFLSLCWVCAGTHDIGVDDAAKIAECIARDIKDYDLEA